MLPVRRHLWAASNDADVLERCTEVTLEVGGDRSVANVAGM